MKLRVLRVVAVFAIVLAGCSSRSEDTSEGAPRPAPEVAPSATATAAPPAPQTPALATLATRTDTKLVAPTSDLRGVEANHTQSTTPTTCPLVALQASATGSKGGFDQTTASSAVSFQVPGTLTVTAGKPHDFVALLEFGPNTSESTETECVYVPSGATQFRLASCHLRARRGQPRPGAGTTVSGTYFELHVDAEEPSCRDTVTVRVELGSVAASDNSACTQDSCASHGGVVHTPSPVGTSCAAGGNACTGGSGTCNVAGVCVVGPPPVIDDLNGCTIDACDPVAGVTHTPVADGTPCGPGDICTGVATCSAGTCMAGTPAVVDDARPCTIDRCSTASGVTHTPVVAGTSCSDGLACNGLETCDASGACVAGAPPVIDTGNPCLVGTCDPVTGVSYRAAAAGTVCGGDACSGLSRCTAAGACQAGAPPQLNDGDACSIDSCAPGVGVTHIPIPGCAITLTPPPLDTSVQYDFLSATTFLFSGPGAVQTGVADGAIVPARQIVVRGRALDVHSNPVRGLRVSARGHAELGVTYTREDGRFDFAANGGMSLLVELRADDFLPVSRVVTPTYHTFTTLDDIVVTARDTNVAAVATNAPTFQVARGTPQTDSDGTRTATLLIPPNTSSPDINSATLHVRATELTVGPTGKSAMPGLLPPETGYTYAVEVSVDEAETLGLETVHFNQPLSFYVDNFIGFPVGAAVPIGYYDRSKGVWVPMPSGRVIAILNTAGGSAHVDVTGDGVEDTGAVLDALGLSPDELTQLGATYAGANNLGLWRVQTSHLSVFDENWPYLPAPGADDCGAACTAAVAGVTDNPKQSCGSIIDCHNAALGEAWSVPGTPFSIHYKSQGQGGDRAMHVTLGAAPLPVNLRRVEVTFDVAGQTQKFKVATADALTPFSFTWDGKDGYGRTVQGPQPIDVAITYVFAALYKAGSSFGGGGGGGGGGSVWVMPVQASRPLLEYYFTQSFTASIGAFDPKPLGLGGLTLDARHDLALTSGTLFYGDGSTASLGRSLRVTTFAGSGSGAQGGNHVPISGAVLDAYGGSFGPDGLYYYADSGQVRVLSAAGFVENVVGRGSGDDGDGGPALTAGIKADSVVFGPDGTMYVLDGFHRRVRQVKNGIISAFAGSGDQGVSGDDGPAIAATFSSHPSAIRADAAGYVYIVDATGAGGCQGGYGGNIRRVGPDGIIRLFAGVGGGGVLSGDGGPAQGAKLCAPVDIAFGLDGSAYIADTGTGAVRKVDVGGTIATIAGGNGRGTTGNGGRALAARFDDVQSLTVDRHNNVLVLDATATDLGVKSAIRVIDPQGYVNLLSGSDTVGPACPADTTTGAARWGFQVGQGITTGPDDATYVPDHVCGTVRRISPVITQPIADGSGQVYSFTPAGRHLSTRDERTGATLYSFGYDPLGRLTSVTDLNGLTTTFEHDAAGNPTRIVAPFGQVTTLTTDANGYVRTIAMPDGATSHLTMDSGGLLQQLLDPRGGVHTFQYDADRKLAFDQDPSGGSSALSTTYDNSGRVVTLTSALGHAFTHGTHILPNKDEEVTSTSASGALSTVVTDHLTGAVSSNAPDGAVGAMSVAPDPYYGVLGGQPTSVATLPSGLSRYVTSTRSTLRSDVLDPFSITQDTRTTSTNTPDCGSGAACPKLTWTQTYTAADRRIATTSPVGRASTVLLDLVGRPIQTSVPGVLPVTIHYDLAGRVDQVTQGTRTSSTTFDPTMGWATSFTDPLGRITTVNLRDAVGRVRSVTLPGNRTIFSAYDAAGNVTSVTPPGKLPSGLSYTPIDLEATFTPPVAEDGATGTLQSTYNVDRQLTQMGRADGTILATYDLFGRPAQVTDPFFVATRTYNAADQVIQLDGNQESLAYAYDGPLLLSTTYSGAISGSVSRSFDNLFRVTQLTAAGVSTAYTYDDDGLLTRAGPVQYTRDLTNGRVTGTQAASVLDTWGYDAYGAPNHFDTRDGSGSLLALDYTRDNGGRITQIAEALLGGPATTTTYDYDAAGRLATVAAGATTTTFAYDQNGNRTHVNGVNVATYDAQDRMLTYGDNAYAYTAGGDLLTKTAPAGTTQYTYDLYGSLRHATLPDGTLLDYTIDPVHRRIGKRRNGTLEQGFLYDGIHPVAELDGAGATVSVFQYGARGNVPETMSKAGVNYRFVVDHLGSVRLVINASTGAVAQALSYDPWGNVTSDSAPGFQPFGYAGGLYDRDLKLVRFGARDYDPETGRFTTKDQSGLEGGLNLYVYVGGDPINLIDETGDDATLVLALTEAAPVAGPGAAFVAALFVAGYFTSQAVATYSPPDMPGTGGVTTASGLGNPVATPPVIVADQSKAQSDREGEGTRGLSYDEIREKYRALGYSEGQIKILIKQVGKLRGEVNKRKDNRKKRPPGRSGVFAPDDDDEDDATCH